MSEQPAPFTVAVARRHGLTQRQLSGRAWRRLLYGVYVAESVGRGDHGTAIAAGALVLPPRGAVSGRSAAWLHGADVLTSPDASLEVTVPSARNARRAAVRIRRSELAPSDICMIDGVRTTTLVRTAFDLARLERRVEAVVCLDALLRVGLSTAALGRYLAARPGWRGVRRAAAAIELADRRAETPMESRLRVILRDAGLTPAVNAPIRVGGEWLRPDLRVGSVVVECDGSIHREPDVFAADARRQNRLVNAGFVVLRYTASDIYRRPDVIATQVLAAVAAHRPR
ncbi:MAG: endonuclease domain-containing protein [Mycobacteriales bacterium]|nr:MAG: hypothetical protein DLM56_05245 [Pseudonocardiales bacterium]